MNRIIDAFNRYAAGTLVFRPLSRADAFPIYVAAQNPDFNSRLIWGPPDNLGEVLFEVDKLITEQTNNETIALSVCERDNGKWVGLIKFSHFQDSLSMSLWTHPDYWKTTAAFRCAESALDIVLRSSALPHLYACIVKANQTMEKMVLSNGFIYQRDVLLRHSRGHNVACGLFKLERAAWVRRPKISPY